MTPEERTARIMAVLEDYPPEERPAVTLRLLAGVLGKMEAAAVLEYRLKLEPKAATPDIIALADEEVARRLADGR